VRKRGQAKRGEPATDAIDRLHTWSAPVDYDRRPPRCGIRIPWNGRCRAYRVYFRYRLHDDAGTPEPRYADGHRHDDCYWHRVGHARLRSLAPNREGHDPQVGDGPSVKDSLLASSRIGTW